MDSFQLKESAFKTFFSGFNPSRRSIYTTTHSRIFTIPKQFVETSFRARDWKQNQPNTLLQAYGY